MNSASTVANQQSIISMLQTCFACTASNDLCHCVRSVRIVLLSDQSSPSDLKTLGVGTNLW